MSNPAHIPSEQQRQRSPAATTAVEFLKDGAVLVGSMILVVVFIPALVLASAAAMLALFWPLYLGAYLEYGFVPGDPVRATQSVWPEWYLLAFAWLGLLVVAPILVRRYRTARRLARSDRIAIDTPEIDTPEIDTPDVDDIEAIDRPRPRV